MKRGIIIGLAILLAGAATAVLWPAPEKRVIAAFQKTLIDPALDVTLAGCDLLVSINAEQPSESEAGIALMRVTQRADLRMYNFSRVRIVPNGDQFTYVASRNVATQAMVDQAQAVFTLVDGELKGNLPEDQGIREALNAPNGALSMQVMAEVVDDHGSSVLIPHADAPRFYAFARAVEDIEGPVSFLLSTTFSEVQPSIETFLMGSVQIIPPLQYQFPDEASARDFGQAIHDYAARRCA